MFKGLGWQSSDTHRDEQVGNLLLILSPGLAVLDTAPLDITQSTMGNHAGEEDGVEPREGAGEASDQTPIQGEVQIAGVVDLAGLAICSGR